MDYGYSVFLYNPESKPHNLRIAWFLSLTDAIYYCDDNLLDFFAKHDKCKLLIVDKSNNRQMYCESNYKED